MPSDAFNTAVAGIWELRQQTPADPPPDLATIRAGFEAGYSSSPVPEGVSFTPVDAGGVPAEWVEPQDAETGRTILYFHGGGYMVGSLNTHRHIVSRLAQGARARLLNVGYRLAPEHPYPAALDDAMAAYSWHLTNGGSPERTALAGDSAGGGLVIAMAMRLRDEGHAQPACITPISPWTDLTFSGDSATARADRDPMVTPDAMSGMVMAYAASLQADHPYISPVFGTFEGLAPMMIQVGSEETLYDDSTRVVEKIQAAGGEVEFRPWQDMIHVWHLFAGVAPEADAGIAEMADYIAARC